ncbi:uncharacterized protein LOC131435812 [Malaya genurostris]|uniref:uncharacterized protein LOC131435812 n=1 Tax=Malaya genurostris TaxID=325434 RepID=UPI0026F3B867|nr:uncharacterized protein LOC131435812 [Malaya genurostris]XP_058460010.1 uncharacterized protein LOC131435812 [Malaya genurostris]
MKRLRFLVFIVLAGVLLRVGRGPDPVAGDFIENLTSGVRMAGKLFGIDTISDVADLVAKGLSGPSFSAQPDTAVPMQQQASSMMSLMWKILGMDGNKLGALVMNALIFVAHVIATNLGTFRKPTFNQISKEDPPKQETSSILQSESPLDWVLNNRSKQFRSMLDPIREVNITDFLEADLENLKQTASEDTDCIKLLLCKIKPFIWKMQDVVRNRLETGRDNSEPTNPPENIAQIIYKSVPKLNEFESNGARCEAQFKHCVRDFGRK